MTSPVPRERALTDRQKFALFAATSGWMARMPQISLAIEGCTSRQFHREVNWNWDVNDAIREFDRQRRVLARRRPR